MLERAWEAGVGHIIVIGESPASAELALRLAEGDRRLSATAGIHPHDAAGWNGDLSAHLVRLLAHPRIVAAGEMGLDYHYDHSPRPQQQLVFETQLALAGAAGKAAIIHAREADDDVAAILRDHSRTPIILHSFSSGPALQSAGLALDAYFSFSGMITFKNWRMNQAVLSAPLDRILIETDAPYLAPTPHRGKRNEPAFVGRVAEQIALVRGMSTAEVIAATGRNAVRVFGLT